MNLKKSFRSIHKVTGISEEEYINLILDLGCEYVKKNVPANRYDKIISSKLFWNWYLSEWTELDESFTLDVCCQAKKFRDDAVYNAANYKFLKFTTLPRLSENVAKLLSKPMEPYLSDETIRRVSSRAISKKRHQKIIKNG